MAELQHPQQPPPAPSPTLPPPPVSDVPPPSSTAPPAEIQPPQKSKPPLFDPSRMIGIIRRKALIKDLAAAYHAECLAYCQELLELQRKCEEPHLDVKTTEDKDTKKETTRPPKRMKKTR